MDEAGSHPSAGHRAGRGVSALRAQSGGEVAACGLRPELLVGTGGGGGRRSRCGGGLRGCGARGSAAARVDPADGGRRARARGWYGLRDSPERCGDRRIRADLAGRGHLPRLFARLPRAGQPAFRLPLHQLHQLRTALHHHSRHPVRSRQHHHGALSHVRGVPAGIRRPGESPVPRAAECLPRVRSVNHGNDTAP